MRPDGWHTRSSAGIPKSSRLKLAILPSSPSLAGAEVELVNELGKRR